MFFAQKMDIITITDLTKRYKDVTAVNSLNLSVKKGDIHGILGPNGAGKSTLISCIVGLNEPDTGSITYENHSVMKKWSRNIGYVPQELAIYPELSAYENIRFFASLYGLKGSNLEARVDESLAFVGLSDVKEKKASTFSGGMKRRLNLACAVTHSPKLIIMDEPTVGIDPQSRNRILENVKRLNEQGVTVIYTTHYMEEVESICNSITVMDHGNIIVHGSKEKIMGLMGEEIVYMVRADIARGNWNHFLHTAHKADVIQDIQEIEDQEEAPDEKTCVIKVKESSSINFIISAASESGLILKSIAYKEPSLEEIFLELTGKELRD
jgi:ABC-2 type transport system ATP-binding protein